MKSIVRSWAGSAAASMVEIVQGVISADVAGPLLNGVRGLLETPKTLPTTPETLGRDGVTVEEVASIRRAPEEGHPMLTRQLDGIGIGNGAARVRRLAGHLVGSVHVQKISADEGIALTGSSQGGGVVHVSSFFSSFPLKRLPREGVFAPSRDCPLESDSRPCYRKTGLGESDYRFGRSVGC